MSPGNNGNLKPGKTCTTIPVIIRRIPKSISGLPIPVLYVTHQDFIRKWSITS